MYVIINNRRAANPRYWSSKHGGFVLAIDHAQVFTTTKDAKETALYFGIGKFHVCRVQLALVRDGVVNA